MLLFLAFYHLTTLVFTVFLQQSTAEYIANMCKVMPATVSFRTL